ncbi:MAG: complex I subunit 1 family protein [Candidatus Eremiobacteraeota bacterium]|nr:complex I subunit 1 family protein [Candidatus Eremiobacteraeota bacterium]
MNDPQAVTQQIMQQQLMTIGLAMLAVIIAPFAGGFLAGLDRILTARLQGRKGPPVWQPFYDVFKLLGKNQITASRMQLVWMYAYLAIMVFCLIFIALGLDMLLTVFLLGFAGVCLVLGGFSSKSPYSHFGANRELVQMLAYEPVLLLMALAVYFQNKTFLISRIYDSNEPLMYSMWPIFIALVIIITIKLRKSPFDFSTCHHAHQEIVRGILTEYSGSYYALFMIAEWYEIIILLWLVALFWAVPLWVGVLIALAVYFLEMFIDNIAARMTIGWMVKYSWVAAMVLCMTNLVYLFIKRGVF